MKSREATQRSRIELFRVLHNHLLLVRPGYPVPLDCELDTLALLSFGKSLYGANLSTFRFADWQGVVKVSDAEFLLDRPLLRAYFRSFNKSLSGFYVEFIKW